MTSLNLVEEEITTGGSYSLAKQYTWGIDLSGTMQGAGGVGGLVFIKDFSSASSADYAYHFDANGNVLQLTDSSGNLAASYRYDAFGKVREATGSYAFANSFQFSTKYFDPETQLNYYGYRYYSSNLGRWINRDPIGELGKRVSLQKDKSLKMVDNYCFPCLRVSVS
ncbi:MAG: RHS repeat-associated core domain-containing protein [Verrucomicrobiota bacterium]